MKLVSNHIDLKELIAARIFDYGGEDYIRPSEEDVHKIAEEIIELLNDEELLTEKL